MPIGSKVGRFSSTRTAQRIYCSVACIDEWFINKHNNIIVSSVIAIDLYFFIGRVVLQLQYHSILEDGTQSNFRNHLASPTLLLGVADRCRVRRGKCHMIPLEFHVCHLAFLPGSIWGRPRVLSSRVVSVIIIILCHVVTTSFLIPLWSIPAHMTCCFLVETISTFYACPILS